MLSIRELRALSNKLISNPDNYMESYRHNVQMYLEQKNMTIAEVAEAADLSESTLKSFLYGKSKSASLDGAIKLAKVFHVSVDELVGCGTLTPQTCETLQIMRQLPERFSHFVRWATHYHYEMLTSERVTERAVEIMNPEIGPEGNMVMTNDMSVMDFPQLPDEIRLKVFMGIKLPSDIYAPKYYENDILLIANDRPPRPEELVVVTVNDNMWVLKHKQEIRNGRKTITYYSIRDNGFRATEKQVKMVLGYVVKAVRNETID